MDDFQQHKSITEHCDSLEDLILIFLHNFFGFSYETSVVILDLTIMFLTLFIGFILGQLYLISLMKPNFRWSSGLKNLVFQVNQHEDIVEVDFRHPKNFIDRVVLIIGLHFLLFSKRKRLQTKHARNIVRIYTIVFLALVGCFLISILFAFHVTYKFYH